MTREEFMDMVYSELHSDGDNNRANRIIDAADEYVETEGGSILDDIKGYIDHIKNTGMEKKKSLEFIEKFIDRLKAENEPQDSEVQE